MTSLAEHFFQVAYVVPDLAADAVPDAASCIEVLGFDDATHAFMTELKRKGAH